MSLPGGQRGQNQSDGRADREVDPVVVVHRPYRPVRDHDEQHRGARGRRQPGPPHPAHSRTGGNDTSGDDTGGEQRGELRGHPGELVGSGEARPEHAERDDRK
jgi:hypothetical protein